MLLERPKEKAGIFSVSHVETNKDFLTSRTHQKELVSSMTQTSCQPEIAIIKQSGDANLAQSITQHMKMLSLNSLLFMSFLSFLAQGLMAALSIGSILLGIMSREMFDGQQKRSKPQIDFRAITG